MSDCTPWCLTILWDASLPTRITVKPRHLQEHLSASATQDVFLIEARSCKWFHNAHHHPFSYIVIIEAHSASEFTMPIINFDFPQYDSYPCGPSYECSSPQNVIMCQPCHCEEPSCRAQSTRMTLWWQTHPTGTIRLYIDCLNTLSLCKWHSSLHRMARKWQISNAIIERPWMQCL